MTHPYANRNNETGQEIGWFAVGGRAFPAREKVANWQVMKMSGADENRPAEAMTTMMNFLRYLIDDRAWPEFDQHMDDIDVDPEELGACLYDYVQITAGRPKDGPTPGVSSTPSTTPSSQQFSRVVSLSQGTVHTRPKVGPLGLPDVQTPNEPRFSRPSA